MYRLWCYLDYLAETEDLVIAKRWLRRHMRTCPRRPLRGPVEWVLVDISGLLQVFWVPAHPDDAPTGHKVVGPRALLPEVGGAGGRLAGAEFGTA